MLTVNQELILEENSQINSLILNADLETASRLNVNNLTWSTGRISETGDLSVSSGNSVIVLEGNSTIGPGEQKTLDTNLFNRGVLRQQSSVGGSVLASLTNEGRYEIEQGDLTHLRLDIINRGVLERVVNDADPTANTSTIASPITNEGTIKTAENTALHLTGIVTHRGSAFEISLGSSVNLQAGNHVVTAERQVDGSDLNFKSTGSGQFVVEGGEFKVVEGATAEFRNGTPDPGLMIVGGNVLAEGVIRNRGTALFQSGMLIASGIGRVENAGRFIFRAGKDDDGKVQRIDLRGTFINKSSDDPPSASVLMEDSALYLRGKIENQTGTAYRMRNAHHH